MKRTADLVAFSPLTAASPALSIPWNLSADEMHERDRLVFGEDYRTDEEILMALAQLQAAGKLHFLSSAEVYAACPDQDDDDKFSRNLKHINAEWNDRIIAMAEGIRLNEALARVR